jgi:hypothetical protein
MWNFIVEKDPHFKNTAKRWTNLNKPC